MRLPCRGEQRYQKNIGPPPTMSESRLKLYGNAFFTRQMLVVAWVNHKLYPRQIRPITCITNLPTEHTEHNDEHNKSKWHYSDGIVSGVSNHRIVNSTVCWMNDTIESSTRLSNNNYVRQLDIRWLKCFFFYKRVIFLSRMRWVLTTYSLVPHFRVHTLSQYSRCFCCKRVSFTRKY